MEAHGSDEILTVVRQVINEGEILELVVETAFAAKTWGQDTRVFQDVPAEESGTCVVGTLVEVIHSFASAHCTDLFVLFLLAYLVIVRVACLRDQLLHHPEHQSTQARQPEITELVQFVTRRGFMFVILNHLVCLNREGDKDHKGHNHAYHEYLLRFMFLLLLLLLRGQ